MTAISSVPAEELSVLVSGQRRRLRQNALIFRERLAVALAVCLARANADDARVQWAGDAAWDVAQRVAQELGRPVAGVVHVGV